MAKEGGNIILRDYRKGNWTPSETMILIEAKKMDDERRLKRSGESDVRNKSVEPRWKWVEDYCWRKGCLRSINQCNDKWDNLIRDYKKVRNYERKKSEGNECSYWKIERNERKERNLPSNMSPHIYDALVEVLERKGANPKEVGTGDQSVSASNPINTGFAVVERIIDSIAQPSLPLLQQHHMISSTLISPVALPQPPLPPGQPVLPLLTYSQQTARIMIQAIILTRLQQRKGEEKKLKIKEPVLVGTSNASTSHDEMGTTISKSACIIAEAIQTREERKERRHRKLMSLHERRLKMEESKMEIRRQGINDLVHAINKFANTISTLASQYHNQFSPN